MKTVIHFTDSSVFGGAEQVLLHLLASLDRTRWRPVLFHHPEPGLARFLQQAHELGAALRPVPRLERLYHLGRLPRFVRALRAEHASVLHAHLTWPLSCKYGLVASAIARVPVVVATAHLYVELPPRRVLQVQPRLIAATVDRYLAVSRAVRRQLCDQFGIAGSKVQLVPNGIPLARFDRPAPASLRPALGARSGQPIVLTVGRLERQKGQTCLLEAAPHVPEALFVLAGDGTDRAVLEARARALDGQVRVALLGHREDIPGLLASCDVFVLPSLYEGLPLSILEAMAAGKPVIASAIGGNDELVVHGETGLLVPQGDPVALASAIRTVLSDPTLARRLGEAGRARVHREFGLEIMTRHVMEVYDSLLP